MFLKLSGLHFRHLINFGFHFHIISSECSPPSGKCGECILIELQSQHLISSKPGLTKIIFRLHTNNIEMNGARLKLIHHFRQNTLSSQEPRQIKGKCTREEVEINKLQKIRMTNYILAAMSKKISRNIEFKNTPV